MSLNHIAQHNIEVRAFIEKASAYARDLARKPLKERPCPICDSIHRIHYATSNDLQYCRCAECSHIYMNPTVTPEMIAEGFKGDDKVNMEYFTIMSKYKTSIPPKPDPLRDPKMVDIYRMKQSGRLLDVGCAFGEFLHKAKHFYEVEGIEINPYTAPIAAKYFTVYTKYLCELNLPKVYDIVVLHEVLYGSPDPISLLRDISKILKDDGILYIHSGNSDSYAMQLYRDKVNHLQVYTMQNVFNRKSLTTLAERTGFQIKSYRTEWLDIYTTDLISFLNGDPAFLHKRNIHIENYTEKIKSEDDFHKQLNFDLGDRGNYLIAVLGKIIR